MSREKQLIVESGQRLDKAVSLVQPGYSRSIIEKLIENGDITVNGKIVKTKYIVKDSDLVEVNFTELERAVDQIKLSVIYEDDNVVVIDKPVGILAHSKGAFNKEGTVETFIKPLLNGSSVWNNSNRAGIVHRLDRVTSGVMICAKNESTQKYLQKQFTNRNVEKVYIALVSGEMPRENGLIDVPIERNPKKPATFRVGVNGKSAQTNFQLLSIRDGRSTSGSYSLVELRPVTGRTHQLRVHMSYLGCPIVGDDLYSGVAADRLMLHAYSLEITLPGEIRKVFTSPRPEQFDR